MRRILTAGVMFAQLGAGSSGGTSPVSPSVMATEMSITSERGVGNLELLVLWRGSPGWYWRDREKVGAGGSSSSGGGMDAASRSAVRTEWISQSGINLSVRFVPASRQLWILDQEIALNDANVVLVDDVDQPAGPRVVGTLRIDPSFDSSTDLPPRMPKGPPGYRPQGVPVQTFILRSPELVAFLQCDVRAPNLSPYEQQALENFCSWVTQP